MTRNQSASQTIVGREDFFDSQERDLIPFAHKASPLRHKVLVKGFCRSAGSPESDRYKLTQMNRRRCTIQSYDLAFLISPLNPYQVGIPRKLCALFLDRLDLDRERTNGGDSQRLCVVVTYIARYLSIHDVFLIHMEIITIRRAILPVTSQSLNTKRIVHVMRK